MSELQRLLKICYVITEIYIKYAHMEPKVAIGTAVSDAIELHIRDDRDVLVLCTEHLDFFTTPPRTLEYAKARYIKLGMKLNTSVDLAKLNLLEWLTYNTFVAFGYKGEMPVEHEFSDRAKAEEGVDEEAFDANGERGGRQTTES